MIVLVLSLLVSFWCMFRFVQLDNLSRGGKDAVTALHAAAVNGWLDCVEYLIAAGAHPNAIDGDGW